jgi:hypothetical protein
VLYIYGSEEAGAARANRDKLVSRAEAALAKVAAGLAKRPHQDPEAVSRRAAKAVSAGHVGDLLRTEVVPGPGGVVSLRWWRDDEAVNKAEATDGLYALVTNMGPGRASAARLLGLYKDQALSERAHHFLKGPIAVRPVFLKSNRRAAALVQVCSIALLVYGLVEAEVRKGVSPARLVQGLLPEGRAARPTAENIFKAFSGLGYQRVRTDEGLQYVADPLSPAQAKILGALGISSVLPPSG